MSSKAARQTTDNEQSNKFGTFGGVYTPSVLTILGVILFLRAGFVVGEAGVLKAIGILLIAKTITFFTAISVSAISTNMQVRGGGAYFMISRVLGAEFGGAIGLALFFAQALSVPFYILGFTEALVASYPGLSPYFLYISLSSAAVFFGVSYVGASWAIKAQYFIMAVLFLAIFVSFGGMILLFSPETLQSNWGSGYTALDPQNIEAGKYSFWTVFAIYFPAVTGILAGVNMSGDLKDPARSIPRGTFFALGTTFVVYLILLVLCGGAFERQAMIANPYETLKGNALWGATFLVAAGVYAASLSSALGSYLGAPRILQAVARDRILGFIRPFAQGSTKGDEPRRALVLTGIITVIVLVWAGGETDGGALNIVASIITMFFLYTYGMTNMAAFIEAFGRNPSFRPRFRFFHWSTALLGTLGCVGVAFLIDPLAAVVAIVILGFLLWYIQRQDLKSNFGDARRGFVYSNLRQNLVRLSQMEEDPKNWRPTILVFSGNPSSRETLVTYAIWLESGRGIVLMANFLQAGTHEQNIKRRAMAESQLKEFCKQKNMQAFPVIATGDDLESSIALMIQTTSIGPIRPNICMFGWSQDPERYPHLLEFLRIAESNQQNLVLVKADDTALTDKTVFLGSKRIDVWWRGKQNGELMLILAHLLTRNWEWSNAEIRVLRMVDDEAGIAPAREALQNLIDEARVDARAVTFESKGRSFKQILFEKSSFAHCVFLGFELPDSEGEARWHANFQNLLQNMPPVILVNSIEKEDILGS